MSEFRKNSGQVMLMSVLLICGAILGVSALASTLVLQQLKKSTGAGESARAVFAADAGAERALWLRYHDEEGLGIWSACKDGESHAGSLPPVPLVKLNGKDEYTIVFNSCDSASSLGQAGRSARAFTVFFNLCAWDQLAGELCQQEEPQP
jgi:hypothetical protein